MNIKVIFAPEVDKAILNLIDYVDIESIPALIHFLEKIQSRLINTLSTAPESGSPFQDTIRYFVIEGYIFLYEYDSDKAQILVLDFISPGQNWR